MFITLSKTIGKIGGVRIGVGKRITSKNAWWMLMLLSFAYIFKAMWYMCIFSLWLMYAMCYGIYWLISSMIKAIIRMINSKTQEHSVKHIESQTLKIESKKSTKYCDVCGEEIIEGNSFCTKCGNIIAK